MFGIFSTVIIRERKKYREIERERERERGGGDEGGGERQRQADRYRQTAAKKNRQIGIRSMQDEKKNP